ncbi:MAG: M61 family metallopeptidase, partial [Hymenobacteraceae bacterium]|nr:M61 family metallopeptidase [Hymenobacteraceae bacterium]
MISHSLSPASCAARLGAALLLTFAVTSARAQGPGVQYTVTSRAPSTHYLQVGVRYAPTAGTDATEFKLPVWTPGSYLVREYAKHLDGFTATDADGKPLVWEKTDKATWRVRHQPGQAVKLTYQLYANEPSVRTNVCDDQHACVIPAATFMYVAGHLDLPATVSVALPTGWNRVSTALPAVAGSPNTFRAADYDELVDSPLELGAHREFAFVSRGIKHRVALAGGGFNADTTKLKVDMAAVCEQAANVFGELPVKDQYLFIVHHYTTGSGGLEHKNSTVLDVSRTTYDTPEGYRGFLELVAHEYFHLWNVKRLRPAALGPFKYDQENYTHMLWVAEGFTAYYDNLLVYRAGRESADEFLTAQASSLASLENQPGNRVQAVAESSWDAWIKAYRPSENSRNAEISYYPKGAQMALIFDLQIAAHSAGKQNLDDMMRWLYRRYAVELNRGYTDDEFRQAVSQFTGRNQDEFFARYIYGANDVTPELRAALAGAGYELLNEAAQPAPLTLGASLSGGSNRFFVRDVRRDGPAWLGGLSAGDEVVAFDSQPLTDTNLDAALAKRATPTAAIKLDIKHDNLPRTLTITPAPVGT